MLRAILILSVLSIAFCDESRKTKYVDPITALDQRLSQSLAYHYLSFPWTQLIRAAAGLEYDNSFEDPKIVSDDQKYEIRMNVKRFSPEELKIRVKNRNIIVEGKHNEKNEDKHFIANHFVQRFVLPPGSKQEEVVAVINEDNILVVSVPRHELPPPPPEREVPIEVKLPTKTESPDTVTKMEKVETTTQKKETPVQTSTVTPLEQMDLVEATTHVGKIRKKDLKDTVKVAKDNEVTKGLENNGLDYALIDAE